MIRPTTKYRGTRSQTRRKKMLKARKTIRKQFSDAKTSHESE